MDFNVHTSDCLHLHEDSLWATLEGISEIKTMLIFTNSFHQYTREGELTRKTVLNMRGKGELTFQYFLQFLPLSASCFLVRLCFSMYPN